MSRIWLGILAIVVGTIGFSPAAVAQKRVALVIGNSAYQYTPPLTNPRNDATDVAVVMRALGFEVIEGLDLNKAVFDRKIEEFAEALTSSAAGVFFYAGHGLQVNGQNFLVPIDSKAALDFEMVRVDVIALPIFSASCQFLP